MNSNNLLRLAIALLMFGQIAQTLYSPALADIGQAFRVTPAAAAQLLSVYFLAFAAGVVVWGRACDHIGRRPSMLGGLALYALATVMALSVSTFSSLLVAQALAAFGAAVGSVVTQTLLRDRFNGPDLARVFSVVGMALAISPALGLFVGANLVSGFGYRGVLVCLLTLALILFGWSAWSLPETRSANVSTPPLFGTLRQMLQDLAIWRAALLVAVFNIALFSYYSLGPFEFQRLGLGPELFGYSGVVLALGSGLGAGLNKHLLKRGVKGTQLIVIAAIAALLGALGVQGLRESVWFIAPMLLVVLAFGMAIPNILGSALTGYGDRLGTAGALFGLMYYLLIGAGLMLAAWSQALGWTLLICAVLAVFLSGCRRRTA
ncbi:MFS transporter [Pseudomonas sp. H3(2019)]|uniref:MFS transporter n=1 Tax=Pseudomonas sp. H3(2019) TaxID=2598724 RepID=UPI0011964F42|nr:MFS transporter [Pseudomonas sp. H3(2019)]TVT81408.1 multidrug effflux MFS transporter [Pseudomonas sp. H3(2019)]